MRQLELYSNDFIIKKKPELMIPSALAGRLCKIAGGILKELVL